VAERACIEREGDIDVVMVNGYGFPKWEGGPVFWARDRGADPLAGDFEWQASLSGAGFVRGDVQRLLR
jgi:3-hydroxyacyl-CoA dehydrogenase